MPFSTLDAAFSLVLVVDIQPAFMNGIYEADRVFSRSEFLVKAAKSLGVPALATEQYPERMGGTDERFLPLLSQPPMPKMLFSCLGCDGVLEFVRAHEKTQIVLVGIETHICVTQTALGLAERGIETFVCADAVSARTLDRHEIGIERMRDSGAQIVHSESVVYEWMRSAEHESFRDVLKLVKEYA